MFLLQVDAVDFEMELALEKIGGAAAEDHS